MRNSIATTAAVLLVGLFAGSPFAEAANDIAGTATLHRGQPLSAGSTQGIRGGTTVFDSFTTATGLTTTTGTPRTFMGGVFTSAGAGPQVDISALTLYPATVAAANYTNLRVNVQFWNVYTVAGTPIFSSPAGAVMSWDAGALAAVANSFYTVDLTLGTPIRLNSLANKGIVVNYQVDSGAGLVSNDNVTSLLTYGGNVSVGTWAFNSGNGFLRNASGRTDFNFLSSDLRTFTGITDAALGVILVGNPTVPVALQSFNID